MNTKASDTLNVAKNATTHLCKPVSERKLSDYQPFFNSLHEEVVLEYASPDGRSQMRGKQTVVDYVSNLFSTLASPNLEEDTELETPLEFFSNGDRVVVLWKEWKRNKKTGATRNSQEVAIVVEFRDGLITRMLRFNT